MGIVHVAKTGEAAAPELPWKFPARSDGIISVVAGAEDGGEMDSIEGTF